MVQVLPFQGLRYKAAQIPDYEAVTAPPYDVISSQAQQALHDKNPYNVIRLILGLKEPQNDVYTRAHETLEAWRKAGILQEDPAACFYAYSQTWPEASGEKVQRRGFIGRLQLESYETGQVLPHEFTLGGPKADRLALMKATGSVLSPIFCLYQDPAMTIETLLFEMPLPADAIQVTDQDEVLHCFWPVSDAELVKKLQELLASQSVLIADGHHRYETACAYRDWRREHEKQQDAPLGSLPWDFTMAFFTNMSDSGLRVYPTHRVLVSLPQNQSFDLLKTGLAEYFEAVLESNALFWVQEGTGPKQALGLKAGVDLSAIPEPLRELDVAILDQLVFQQILKHSANDLKDKGHLLFIREDSEVVEKQAEGAYVFWVHAPGVDVIKAVCSAGYRMPQKSTYFYPKLLSGLVMYYYGV